MLTSAVLLTLASVVIIAVIVIKNNSERKLNIDSPEIVVPARPPSEFLSNIRLGDDDRLYVSGFLDSDSLMEIKESMYGGILSIELESINGDVESLLNFSKLVEIYKKPIVVRGVCPLPCAVVAFAGSNVEFEEESITISDYRGQTVISEVERAEMLKRLAALGVKEPELKAAGEPRFDMSALEK